MNYVKPITDIKKIDAMSAYLKTHNKRDYLLFVTAINTGIRVSELLDKKVALFRDMATKGYVEFKYGNGSKNYEDKSAIEIGLKDSIREHYIKNNVVRIEISQALKDVILDELRDSDDKEFVFKSRNNKTGEHPITRQRAYDMLNEAALEVGITEPFSANSLRKTFGYWYFQKTHDIRTLMHVFGHSTEEMTYKYIGVYKKENIGISLGV